MQDGEATDRRPGREAPDREPPDRERPDRKAPDRKAPEHEPSSDQQTGQQPVSTDAKRALLSDVPADETDVGWGESPADDDDRILREVPPHHL